MFKLAIDAVPRPASNYSRDYPRCAVLQNRDRTIRARIIRPRTIRPNWSFERLG